MVKELHELYADIKNNPRSYVLKKALAEKINEKLGEKLIEDHEIHEDFEDLVFGKGLEKTVALGKYQPFFHKKYLSELMEIYDKEEKLIKLAEDYYDVLGVVETALGSEIKKAYQKLSIKYHPDKKKGDAEIFRKIEEANELLSDSKRRKRHDLCLLKVKKFDEEKQKRIDVLTNQKKLALWRRESKVSPEIVEKVTNLIKETLAESGLIGKKKAELLSKSFTLELLLYLDWETQISYESRWKNAVEFADYCEQYLYVIDEEVKNQGELKEEEREIEEYSAKINKLLNYEPALKIVNTDTEYWGEIHSDFWNYEETIIRAKFKEAKNFAKDTDEYEQIFKELNQLLAELEWDILLRKEVKKRFLDLWETEIKNGDSLLASEVLNQITSLGVATKIQKLKNICQSGKLNEDNEVLNIIKSFVDRAENGDFKKKELGKLEIPID